MALVDDELGEHPAEGVPVPAYSEGADVPVASGLELQRHLVGRARRNRRDVLREQLGTGVARPEGGLFDRPAAGRRSKYISWRIVPSFVSTKVASPATVVVPR